VDAHGLTRLLDQISQLSADWIGKTDMSDDTVAKECRNARFGSVEKLIRQNDIERPKFFPQGADGAGCWRES